METIEEFEAVIDAVRERPSDGYTPQMLTDAARVLTAVSEFVAEASRSRAIEHDATLASVLRDLHATTIHIDDAVKQATTADPAAAGDRDGVDSGKTVLHVRYELQRASEYLREVRLHLSLAAEEASHLRPWTTVR